MKDPENDAKQMEGRRWSSVLFQSHRPHTGTQSRYEPLGEILYRGQKISVDQAKILWEQHYESSGQNCSHVFWTGRCAYRIGGLKCDVSR